MPEYQWALGNGSIILADYDRTKDCLSNEQVKTELLAALQQYGHVVNCKTANDQLSEVYDVSIGEDMEEKFIICAKGTTPGGRANLNDEQRIQQKSKNINYAFQQLQAGNNAVLMGVYKREGQVVFCAWKLNGSTAGPETPISKQIKIATIANAMKEGFAQQARGEGEYVCAFRKEFIYFYLRNASWLHGDLVTELMTNNPPAEDADNACNDSPENKLTRGTNIILYGVPGCGKSHEIKTNYCNDKTFMERVVFHPDYTYSDFVGQILPKTDGEKISYPFTAGPFTTILKKAIHDPDHMYYLVIEEINRGNAPAIFGEVFQLLDRENGESEYGITNFDIARCVYGPEKEEEEIKIPSNLTILATMNTADQNVFTLDTAFKRRWTMRSIENNIADCEHARDLICGTTTTWGTFARIINETIIDIGEGNLSSEDNRLGAYFVKAEDLQDEKVFAEKVLMYLWNDAFKYDRDKVFKPEYRTLEELLKGFYAHKFGVFVSSLGFADVTVSSTVAGDLSEDEYLTNKAPELVDLYKTIRNMVQLQVPNLTTYTTASKAYIGMGSEDNKKKNFAEFSIRKGQLSLEIEKPDDAALLNLGEEIPYNGSHDHYFGIGVTAESDLDLVVAAIIASYKKLKQG